MNTKSGQARPGTRTARSGLPLVCAGGVSEAAAFRTALEIGYAGVQMGTRFIATTELRRAS